MDWIFYGIMTGVLILLISVIAQSKNCALFGFVVLAIFALIGNIYYFNWFGRVPSAVSLLKSGESYEVVSSTPVGNEYICVMRRLREAMSGEVLVCKFKQAPPNSFLVAEAGDEKLFVPNSVKN